MSATNKNYAKILNSTAICEYTLTVTHDDQFEPDDFDNSTPYAVTYGFASARLYNPKTSKWEILDSDKFRVSADNFATAKREFWDRWSIYSTRRFGYRVQCNSVYGTPQASLSPLSPSERQNQIDQQRKSDKVSS